MEENIEIKEMKILVKSVLEILSDKDTAKAVAKMIRNIFDALVEEGFSKDQAFNLLTKIDFRQIK